MKVAEKNKHKKFTFECCCQRDPLLSFPTQ